jgi:cytochrome c oxidase subunit 3
MFNLNGIYHLSSLVFIFFIMYFYIGLGFLGIPLIDRHAHRFFLVNGDFYGLYVSNIVSLDLVLRTRWYSDFFPSLMDQFQVCLLSLRFIYTFFPVSLFQVWNSIFILPLLPAFIRGQYSDVNLSLLKDKFINSVFFSSKFQKSKRHFFHILDVSPWPLLGSFAAFSLAIGGVMFFHNYAGGGLLLLLGFFNVLLVMFGWWRDVVRESTFNGFHTFQVKRGLRLGVVLFILSEVMFFFAFFWAFFHASLSPSIELGCIWPPVGIQAFNPWDIPLLNTMILLFSGVSVTLVHHSLVGNNFFYTFFGFIVTLVLAFLFTALQAFEYSQASFSISDGIYGSTFFLATGFHGIHVLIGTIFLGVCFFRFFFNHFTKYDHLGFAFAAWYWHFVDVVWLFLFISIYWWGSLH